MKTIPVVQIDLLRAPQSPRYGSRACDVQFNFRCTEGERLTIAKAAKVIGMSAAQFLRVVILQASEQVLLDGAPNSAAVPLAQRPARFDPNKPPGAKT